MDPETSKSRSVLGFLPGVGQTSYMPSKSVIDNTVVFKPPDTDGSVLRLIATRRRLVAAQKSGSFSRPSVGARRDDLYPQETTLPRV